MQPDQSDERVLISFDYALKRLLRNKANYEVLEGFLSVLLNTDVKVKSIGESESNKEHAADKYNKVDVLVEDETGEIMLIELQFRLEIDYLHRMLYGTSKAIAERMIQGAAYTEVKKIYSINIVYFDLGQGDDYVYHGKTHFRGLHKNDELQLSKSQRETFGKATAGDIYPEYYILKVNNFDDNTRDMLDEWIYFLKHNAVKNDFQAKGLAQARVVLARDNLSPEEQKAYDYMQDQRSEDLSAIASMKLEGRIEGREEGRIEGREEGREERKKLADELEKERKEREKERKEREKEREKLLAEIARLKQNNKK
ncbi:MAG: Rpn family recombination-promoting nuclease/putative transposase [Planctomycetaceae bacterium]|jgi:predicted transposase/invertase (TIGR01784 family)|nr:Rpn family recombination-promoting nuclease/putative transposase [Planctomycetaceae bacterium]